MKKEFIKGFATKAIHVGQEPDAVTGAVIPPVTLSTTYAQAQPGRHKGYEYSRVSNPTRSSLEKCLASLEGAQFCQTSGSGVSAEMLVFELLSPGDVLTAERDLYGGTLRILNKILKPRNIEIQLLDLSQEENWGKILKKTRMIWLESPTNPELKMIDIKKLCEFAKKRGILTAVDNTFMSPFFQKPLSLGADFSVHSATKYLGGHSDVLAGALCTNDPGLAEKMGFFHKSLGPVLSAFDSYLLLRSLKTLAVRMKAHEQNALDLAKFLEKHPQVDKVIYPGLVSHPQYKLGVNQMSGFGGVLSFHVKGGKKAAFQCLERFKIFTLAESLGGVESLIEHPASMTHASSPHPPADSLIRVSVGIEDIEDLKTDMEQALKL